jgi:hypothetical protein
MARKSAEQLRAEIRGESERLRNLMDSRDKAAALAKEYAADVRKATAERDRHLLSARRAGATVSELADDTGLTPGRIRQIAPLPTTSGADRPPRPSAAAVTARIDEHQDDDDQEAEQLPAPPTPGGYLAAFRQVTEQTAATGHSPDDYPDAAPVVRIPTSELGAPVIRARPPAAANSGPGGKIRLPDLDVYSIGGRVDQALTVAGGDMAAATSTLIAHAVDDAMALLGQSRVGATYDHTAHPATPPPLTRPDRKKPDLIWEGRPHWTSPDTAPGTLVTRLDVNGAYLAALRRTHLPIGKLVQDPPGTPFDRRRSGIYLCQVSPWNVTNLPDPMGNRTSIGPVWITDSTLRLLFRIAVHLARFDVSYQPPVVLESWTSGSSENLLTKFGDQLAAARMEAIEGGTARDDVQLEYVKAMYSKFVSTAGDSRANHHLQRPEWVHAIRSQAFANLWLKAQKAVEAGLWVHRLSGTDELHVAGNWQTAWRYGAQGKAELVFPQGRALSTVKVKDEGGTYIVGGGEGA